MNRPGRDGEGAGGRGGEGAGGRGEEVGGLGRLDWGPRI